MTRVWPALCPPWKRTTMSACSDSQSTILPLPSSPHGEPTTTTFAMRKCPQEADDCSDGSDTGRSRLSRIMDDAAGRKENCLRPVGAISAKLLVLHII